MELGRNIASRLLVCVVAVFPLFGVAQDSVFGESYSIHSEILSEDRNYSVHIPASYFSDEYTEKPYPVAYILDGEMQFIPFAGVMNSMSSGANGNYRIPELIVVGISNVDRFRDFTPTKDTSSPEGSEFYTSGGGSNFLEFLEKELIPEVESKYRVASHRLLVGHSLGGLLAVQSLIEKPELFQAYGVIDPSLWWDNGLLLSQAESEINSVDVSNITVYLATPDYSDDNYQITSTDSLLTTLQSKDVITTYDRISNVTHGTVPLLGFYNTLSFVYGDFQSSETSIVELGTDYVVDHFNELSQRLGFEYPPPEKLVELIGQYTSGLPKLSLQFFLLNTSLHPNSVQSHTNLAEAYARQNELRSALDIYTIAQSLAPSNTEIAAKIEDLETRIN